MSSRRAQLTALLFMLLALALPRAIAGQAVYHVLERGETLFSVARTYGVSAESLIKANGITDPDKVRAGMKLIIPGAEASDPASALPQIERRHKVVKGDTLFSLSRVYGVGLDALREANKLREQDLIKPGDILVIPASAVASSARAVSTPTQGASNSTSSPSREAMPLPVRTSAKAVNMALAWPCAGDIRYLDGKVDGVVIKTKQGEAQRAIASGTVTLAEPYRGYTNVVFVRSSSGFVYVYGGNESLSVNQGDKISAGQEIGKVGIDARQGCPAAYFFVFKDDRAIDPAEAPRDGSALRKDATARQDALSTN